MLKNLSSGPPYYIVFPLAPSSVYGSSKEICVSDLRLHFFNSFYHSYQYAYYLIFVLPYYLQVINVYNNYDDDFEEFTIYHQGFFHSVRRNPSLNCFHRHRSLAILGHAVPMWRTRLSLHLVLGLPCRLVHSRGVHAVTLLVHLLSLKRAVLLHLVL